MKKLSCGGLIFNPERKLLIARPRWDSPFWNIPKGEFKPVDATPQDCALREIEEETGITPQIIRSIIDLGQHPYLSGKDVHLFKIDLLLTPTLFCRSLYEEAGKKHPEMVDFRWIDFEERNKWLSRPIIQVIQSVSQATLKEVI